jgi:hypothetical protein
VCLKGSFGGQVVILKVWKKFEMAVTPSLWLLSNKTFYQNVFRIEFGTKKDIMKKFEK